MTEEGRAKKAQPRPGYVRINVIRPVWAEDVLVGISVR